MLTEKVNWNDTDSLCASDELMAKAKEVIGNKPCLFFTFNDYNGVAADMGIRNCLVREYPNNILYEDIDAEWGKGCNMFLYGEELLGKDDDFDEDWVCQDIYEFARVKGYIDEAEDRLIRDEWLKCCEDKGINANNGRKYKAFKDFLFEKAANTQEVLIGAYDIEHCYNETELENLLKKLEK